MRLADIKKIKGYYRDLIEAGDPSVYINKVNEPTFTVKAIDSFIRYGTSFSEFAGYGFCAKSHKEKQNYMTRRYMFRFFDCYNPAEYRDRIGNKALAVKYYSKYLCREQYTKDEGFDRFVDFSSRNHWLFIKKSVGWGGEDARKVFVESEKDARLIWDSLTDDVVVEPVVENHEFLRRIHPQSLNTIKITVLQTPNGPKIVTAIIRFGNGTDVDNVHSGGIAAGINIETGEIDTPAMNKHFERFSAHPITHMPITGIIIPEWERIKEFAIRASLVTPQLRYTSWDIALTENGPIMIEGNWDAEFYMEQTLYNRGHRKLFTDLLEGRA